jgi:hypothetical protein
MSMGEWNHFHLRMILFLEKVAVDFSHFFAACKFSNDHKKVCIYYYLHVVSWYVTFFDNIRLQKRAKTIILISDVVQLINTSILRHFIF